jgi:hypothetical protein
MKRRYFLDRSAVRSRHSFAARRQRSLQRAVCDALEQRYLLSAPAIVSGYFDFESDLDYSARSHTLVIQFDQNVSTSLTADDLRLEAVSAVDPTPGAPDVPIHTYLAYDTLTNTATFTFEPSLTPRLADGNYRATISKQDVTNTGGKELEYWPNATPTAIRTIWTTTTGDGC